MLLELSPGFVKLAIGTGVNEAGDTIVSGKVAEKVMKRWKPILADAIREWAKQQTLRIALNPSTGVDPGPVPIDPKPPERYGLRKRFWEGLLNRPMIKTTRYANLTAGEFGGIAAGSGVRGLPYTFVIGENEGKG
jgi:hypothetical protein